MFKYIKKFNKLSFEKRILINAIISLSLNSLFAAVKIIFAVAILDIFLFVSGLINILVFVAKLQCFYGIKNKEKSFFTRNTLIGISLILFGLLYTIYMFRFIINPNINVQYDLNLGIIIALISFIELALAIRGCFIVFGRGHFYRNIKLINLISALTAIVLTEVALTSSMLESTNSISHGALGTIVGFFTILVGVYILIAPKISIVDKEHNRYILNSNNNVSNIKVFLTNSKLYGNYYYEAKVIDSIADGYIIKDKSPIFKWNIFILIIVITLSEILVFPYAIGAFLFHNKGRKIIKKLDEKMFDLGFERIDEND
ncbi:MAG: hypothetical protein ACI35S_00085 [Anaeroplasma sp.]